MLIIVFGRFYLITKEIDDSFASLHAMSMILELVGFVEIRNTGVVLFESRFGAVLVATELLTLSPNHVHRLLQNGMVSQLRSCKNQSQDQFPNSQKTLSYR